MCEGPSLIAGPIPPDPSLFPGYYRRPSSARGRLEGNTETHPPLLSGPLAPDPSLHPEFYSARTPVPPRIGSCAAHILERSQKGMVGVLLKLEGVSLNSHPPKHKKQVQDFGKENVRRMREIQKRCRQLEAEKERARPTPVKALWTSPKYDNVQSKVMTQLQETNPQKRPECKNFLKAHSHNPQFQRSLSSLHLESDLSEMQILGRTVDFVRHNARAAGKTPMRRSQSLQDLSNTQHKLSSAQKGVVPKYLKERKEQWRQEAEERRKSRPDPSVPPGHTLMPEHERLQTLQTLKNNQCSLVNELLSLPVRSDTLSSQSRRAQLDQQLSEVEEAIKLFSRDKVFVKMDS